MRKQPAFDKMRVAYGLFERVTTVVQQSAAANIGRHSSDVLAAISFAMASRVALGSRVSSTSGAGRAIALVKAIQNFCSIAPQAINFPSFAG